MTFKNCSIGSDHQKSMGLKLKKFWKLHNSMQEKKYCLFDHFPFVMKDNQEKIGCKAAVKQICSTWT